MFNVPHGGAAYPKRTKRVFLLSGTAKQGESVCYNYDALTVTAENDALGTLSAADWTDARRVQVEVPSAANNMHFAGVIDRASEGVVGPNWIEVHEPGSVCKIRTVATVSAGIGGNRNTGALLTFGIAVNSVNAADTNNGRFEIGGLPGCGSAMLLAEGAASVPGDSYLKMAILQTGPESGGVEAMSFVSTLMGDASAVLPVAIQHGVINLSTTDLETAAETAGVISVEDGKFVGQRLVVLGPTAAVSVAVEVKFDTAVAMATALSNTGWDTAEATTLSAPAAFVDAEWNGAAWRLIGSASIT